MLTISQLADYVGVTVRAIRHYHQRGLLAEPERDASGYRRYGAQAVIDLIRIRTLADAGVPLARIEELLAAGPEEFGESVREIDCSLEARIRELKQHRRELSELTAGERLFLPGGVVDYLDRLRAIGVSDRMVHMERDGWIMLSARYPDRIPRWVERKLEGLQDAEFVRMYLKYDEAYTWDARDPRIEEFVQEVMDYIAKNMRPADYEAQDLSEQGAAQDTMLVASLGSHSPSWARIHELLTKAGKDYLDVAEG